MDKEVSERYSSVRILANQIVDRMHKELSQAGFDDSIFNVGTADDADYRLDKDPYSGEYTLAGQWLDDRQGKLGSLLFHSDGSFYVECDIIRPHPQKTKWFVESINAWGKGESIKIDFNLLPMLE